MLGIKTLFCYSTVRSLMCLGDVDRKISILRCKVGYHEAGIGRTTQGLSLSKSLIMALNTYTF